MLIVVFVVIIRILIILFDDIDDTVNCVLRKGVIQGIKKKSNTSYALERLKTTEKYDALSGDMLSDLREDCVPIPRKKQLISQRQLRLPLRCNFMYPVPWNGSTFQPLEAIKHYNLRQDDKIKMLSKYLEKYTSHLVLHFQVPIRPQEDRILPKNMEVWC